MALDYNMFMVAAPPIIVFLHARIDTLNENILCHRSLYELEASIVFVAIVIGLASLSYVAICKFGGGIGPCVLL